MTDNYFARRHDLRKRLSALLKEYDELTSGQSSSDPDIVVKVRKYLAGYQARRETFSVIEGIGRERKKE
jgi:hypothetical protein